jgi:hypothetical protein
MLLLSKCQASLPRFGNARKEDSPGNYSRIDDVEHTKVCLVESGGWDPRLGFEQMIP